MEQAKLQLRSSNRIPVIVSYGIGVNSTAELVDRVRKGLMVDRILAADTGGEKRETYEYLPYFNDWLMSEGFPAIEIVSYRASNFKNWPPYFTLEDNCLTNGTLPSLAFGFKSCSQKWKIAPQDKLIDQWDVAHEVWGDGQKLEKIIGYDAGPADIRRRKQMGDTEDPHYTYSYPLQEKGWDRIECIKQIAAAGLKVPPKSSCFFCPAMQPKEVSDLPIYLLERIVGMEARAMPRLEKVRGLWREGLSKKKALENGLQKVENMTDFILQKGLLSLDRVKEIQEKTGKEIVSYQEGFAQAKVAGDIDGFLSKSGDGYRHRVE